MSTRPHRWMQPEERFWLQVDRRGPDDCWLWTGAVTKGLRRGYGLFGWAELARQLGKGGRQLQAHRVAWILMHGVIPAERLICHRCDTRLCCNPGHLFLGSNADNSHDMVQKSRQARGEGHANAKLTDANVRELRALRREGWKQADLAARFGVSQFAVSRILLGKGWLHVA